MRSATLTRRGQNAAIINPATVLGSALVGWWRSDSLSGLSDGSGIASWADKSANANMLTQATGGNQPVKQTAANGLPAARFTAASHHNVAITSPAGLTDAPGPLTVLVIGSQTSGSGVQTYVEYAGAGNHGFTADTTSGTLELGDYNHVVKANSGVAAGAVALMHYEMQSSTTAYFRANNAATTGTATNATFTAGSSRLALGGSLLYNQRYLDGDIYEVIYVNRVLTAAERDIIARKYVWPRYGVLQGSRYNPTSHLTVPTMAQSFGGSAAADGTVVEASVRYFPAGWNGHKYWLACVPYSGGGAVENPNIFYSDDNATWSTPAGVTNPIVAPRSVGNNADPKLVYNASDGKLYLFWSVENDTVTANNGVWAISSSDGSTWSAPTHVLSVASSKSAQEANVWFDGTQWVMFTQNGDAAPNVVQRRTASAILGPYGSLATCTTAVPGSRSPWHIDVLLTGGVYYLAFSDNDAVRNIWLAKSTDGGSTFTVAPSPVLRGSYDGWDNGSLYRPSLLPPDDTTTNYRLWYTSNVSFASSFLGYTEIPSGELP